MSANKDSFFYFSHFDPLNGEPPEYICSKAKIQLYQARKILKNRTNEEIYSGAEIISWLSSHDDISEHNWSELMYEANALDNDEEYESETDIYSCPYANDLLLSMKILDISDYEEFNNATWPELFAILALGMIANGYENFNYRKEQYNQEAHDSYAFKILGNSFIDATECIGIAKYIMNLDILRKEFKEDALSEIKEKQSLQGKEDSIKRHSKVNKLKRECYKYYYSLKKSGISKRQAAHDFYEALPPERKRLLAPTNANRTLAEGITTFEKKHKFEQ